MLKVFDVYIPYITKNNLFTAHKERKIERDTDKLKWVALY